MKLFGISKQIVAVLLSIIIIFISSLSFRIPVHAENIFKTGWEKFDNWATTKGLKFINIIPFACSQFGALVDSDFAKWIANEKSFMDYWNDSYVTFSAESNDISFSSEFMAYLKQALDEYAKTEQSKEENGGFVLIPTIGIDEVPARWFKNAGQYQSFRGVVTINGLLAIIPRFGARYNNFAVVDPFIDLFTGKRNNTVLVDAGGYLDNYKEDNTSVVNVRFYDSAQWKYNQYEWKYCNAGSSDVYTDLYKGVQYPSASTTSIKYYVSELGINNNTENTEEASRFLCSLDGRRVRVFVSEDAAINYSVGNRKVYFTENYYNYVPEDLSVSIDDLQKSVDDLKDVLDQLLGQIGDNTSEKEIEDLLKQILEELRNQQGGGNEGDGDVNIDIDLSTTNSWLSKIYAKVSQIFDKMSDGSDGTGGSILQKGLDSILVKLDELSGMLKKYLSEITGDLDDIKGQLENMTEQEFDEKSDSFLKDMVDMFSEIADVAKGKFPFSIPNDMRILLERIAVTPSEPAALYTDDMSGVSVYSDDHGGGGSSRDDETEPPGGGGASRPGGSGFVSVEHGGGGSSGEPVEQKDGAPVFRLPIVIERYNIEEYIIIDMSPFESVSRMSRALFSIMYVLCLYNLTFKVMGLWGDLVG